MVRQTGNTLINNSKSWAQAVMQGSNKLQQNKLQQNKLQQQNKPQQNKLQQQQQNKPQQNKAKNQNLKSQPKNNTNQIQQVKQYFEKSNSVLKPVQIKHFTTSVHPRTFNASQLRALQQEFQCLCNLYNAYTYFGKSTYARFKAWIQYDSGCVTNVAGCYSLKHKPVANLIRPQQRKAMKNGKNLQFTPKQAWNNNNTRKNTPQKNNNNNNNNKNNNNKGNNLVKNQQKQQTAWGKNQPQQIRQAPKQQQVQKEISELEQRYQKQMQLLQKVQLKQQELLIKKQVEQRKKLLQYQKKHSQKVQQQQPQQQPQQRLQNKQQQNKQQQQQRLQNKQQQNKQQQNKQQQNKKQLNNKRQVNQPKQQSNFEIKQFQKVYNETYQKVFQKVYHEQIQLQKLNQHKKEIARQQLNLKPNRRIALTRLQNQKVGPDTTPYTLNQLYDAFNYFPKKSYSGDRAWKYSNFTHNYFSVASFFSARHTPYVANNRPVINVTNGLPVYKFNTRPTSRTVIKPYNVAKQGVRPQGNGQYFLHWHLDNTWTHYYSSRRHF